MVIDVHSTEKPIGWIVVDKFNSPVVTGSGSRAAKLYRAKGRATAVACDTDRVLPVFLSDCEWRAVE